MLHIMVEEIPCFYVKCFEFREKRYIHVTDYYYYYKKRTITLDIAFLIKLYCNSKHNLHQIKNFRNATVW